MISRWLRLALLALLGGTVEARAQEPAPNIDPAQIRFITPTAATSSCVGKPTTPMCGIETLIGCASYVWNEACEVINRRVSRPRDVRVEYVIVKAGFVNKDKVRATLEASVDKEYGDIPWLGEDLFQAKVLDRACPSEKTSCEGVPWQIGLFSVGPSAKVPDLWLMSSVAVFDPKKWFVD